jgi:hypothetical protein
MLISDLVQKIKLVAGYSNRLGMHGLWLIVKTLAFRMMMSAVGCIAGSLVEGRYSRIVSV